MLVEEFLPPGGKGHLLLTTRAQAPGTLANPIEVEQLDLAKGTLLLLRRIRLLSVHTSFEQVPADERIAAEVIVQELGGLPLALDQAGAYIEETRCPLASYLDRYRTQQESLLRRRGRTDKQHPEPVATTWSLSFEQVEALNPGAAELLRCCAFLAPDAIPEQLLVNGASELGPLLQPLAEDPLRLDEAIGTLLRFSLIKRKREEPMLSVHRLVQATLRTSMDALTQRTWVKRIVCAINRAFPDVTDYHTWPHCQQFLPHAQACTTWIDHWGLKIAEAGALWNKIGYYLDDRAQYMEATAYYQRAIAISEEVLGPEHPDLATRLSNLGLLYLTQSKPERAELLLQRAIAIGEKILRPEHPNLATYFNNLALLYKTQGKYELAKPLYERVLR